MNCHAVSICGISVKCCKNLREDTRFALKDAFKNVKTKLFTEMVSQN